MGIDYVALIVLGAAYVFSRIQAVPERVRHLGFAVACFGLAGWKLFLGGQGPNLLFAGLAALFGVMYVRRALRSAQ